MEEVDFTFESGLKVLDSVSLSLSRGEILAIVGPSGCGKSTLLRLVAGFLQATQGRIELPNVDSDRHPCAMVFQEDTLLPWLRVRDNASLVTKFNPSLHGQRRELIDDLLTMVGLSDFAKSYPYQLSGGMKRRLAVVVAVATLPQLLLLDEPFSALDEPTRIQVHQDVYALLRRFGIASVLVTHDLGEALCLSDRVLLLSRRPGHVVREYRLELGAERDMLAIRSSSEFLSLYGQIWKDLSDQIEGRVMAAGPGR